MFRFRTLASVRALPLRAPALDKPCFYSYRGFSAAPQTTPQANEMLTKAAELGQASVSTPPTTPSIADIAPVADLSDTVANAAAAATDFAWTTRAVHSFIDVIHSTTGLPWWATIMTGVFIVRAALFPFHTKSTTTTGKIAKIRPELDRLKPMAQKDPVKYRQMVNEVFARQGLKPSSLGYQLAYPFTNMAIWMSFFFGVKSLHEEFPMVAAEHPFWLESLAASDPTYILPILSGVTMFLAMEIPTADPGLTPEMKKYMKYGFRALALVVTPLAGTQFNSGVLLYWITSNLLTILQNVVSRTSWFRRRYNLPPPPPLDLPFFRKKAVNKAPDLITVDLRSLKQQQSSKPRSPQ